MTSRDISSMLGKQILKTSQFSKQDLIKFWFIGAVWFSILYNSHATAGKEDVAP